MSVGVARPRSVRILKRRQGLRAPWPSVAKAKAGRAHSMTILSELAVR